MEEARVRALITELESPDENVRLRAANAFVGGEGEHLKLAVPALRAVFHGDPNPAVKFLAKKALTNLGEDLQGEASSQAVDTAGKAEEFRFVKDGKVLWKAAQDVLREEVRVVLQLLQAPHPDLVPALIDVVESLGSAVTAGPLVQAFLDSGGPSLSAGEMDVPEVGRALLAKDLEEVLHVAQLKSSGINPATAAAMGNLRVPEVFQMLVHMLGSSLPLMSWGALTALGELDDVMAIRPLLLQLGRGGQLQNERILEYLRAYAAEDARVREALVMELTARLDPSSPQDRRIWAARGLGRLQLSDGIDALRSLLDDDSSDLRLEGVRALAEFDMPPEWLASCVRPLLNDQDLRVVAAAAAAHVGGTSQRQAEAKLQELMGGDVAARIELARALAWADKPGVGELLEPLLMDSDGGVRQAAIEAVRALETPSACEFLGGLITAEDSGVAAAVVERVGALGLEQYNDLLVLLLDQVPSPNLLATILEALGRLALPENVPTVGYYLNHEDARVRVRALEALERTNDPRATSLIALSLSDPDHRVRAAAASALWSFGELRSVEAIRALLIGEAKAQAAACRALAGIFARVRNERQLVDRPLLVAALRQAPRYAELARLAAGR